jgi:preprotein translocase subunit SecD
MLNRYLSRIILIVVVLGLALWIDLAPGARWAAVGIDRSFETRLGLDLVGGVQALLEADLPEGTTVNAQDMDVARAIVENRVNGLGVSEALVQVAGDRRIVVELPGETDPERALSVLRQTGLLEFVDMSSISPQQALLLEGQIIQTDYGSSGQTVAPTQTLTNTVTSQIFPTVMTGTEIKTVGVTTSQLGEYQVAFELKPDGAAIFGQFTSAHVGDILAIVLDKRVISTPSIQNPITDGQGVITGRFDLESANALSVQLRYGSLPIPLKIVETRTVGPSLGQDSLNKSLIAGLIGFAVVVIFMTLYYRLPGGIAVISLLMYAAIAFALFRYIPVTLTLPGIAGFLLSTGSALDANILIFERFKEEMRNGKQLLQAVELGFQRAWPSIRDSNIATLITSAILYWFASTYGATIVKGFSLTLALGVAVSLFTALVATRTLLTLTLNSFQPKNKERWFGI